MPGRYFKSIAAICVAATSQIASASETATFSYDAQGRLTGSSYSGSGISGGLNIQSLYDLAGNRAAQTVTGSTNPGRRIVVIPKGTGFSIIPVSP